MVFPTLRHLNRETLINLQVAEQRRDAAAYSLAWTCLRETWPLHECLQQGPCAPGILSIAAAWAVASSSAWMLQAGLLATVATASLVAGGLYSLQVLVRERAAAVVTLAQQVLQARLPVSSRD